ncbi:MAG: hypothetical protein H6502_03765 [Candidatus Woesearchaeota archaeon]|nr:MAG: hypothetical protein H6502_03765 [Candidatus Woesearchaeota archaeon]
MSLLEDGVRALEDLGLSDVLLPFIIIFTIVFAVLEKSNILGTDDKAKGFNAMIALAMAIGVIIPHVKGLYPHNADIVVILNTALPNISLVVIALVMVLIMLNIFGEGTFGGLVATWVPWIALVIVVYIFTSAANITNIPNWLYFLRDKNTQSLIIMILVFGLIYRFIVGGGEKKEKEYFDWHGIGKKTGSTPVEEKTEG